MNSDESIALAKTPVVGKTYRFTVTDCCVPGVEFQGRLVSKGEDLVFVNNNGDKATLHDWAIPGDIEEVP